MAGVAEALRTMTDPLGHKIVQFYHYHPPEYAIYKARTRRGFAVRILYSDKPAREAAQRRSLAQLAALRGQINGLIDGWHNGTTHGFYGLENRAKLTAKAESYDQRVADALYGVLDDPDAMPQALAQLVRIKHDILNERIAWARFEYLIAAFVGAIGLIFLSWLASGLYPTAAQPGAYDRARWVKTATIVLIQLVSVGGVIWFSGRTTDEHSRQREGDLLAKVPQWIYNAIQGTLLLVAMLTPLFAFLIWPAHRFDELEKGYEYAVDLWHAAAAGAVGAFFSIAIAIRKRTVLPDLLRTSNLVDAILRVTIGFIGAAFLLAILKARIVNFQLGDISVDRFEPVHLLVLGFLAGFSERLVPDLLERIQPNGTHGGPDGGSVLSSESGPSAGNQPVTPVGTAEKPDGEATGTGEGESPGGSDVPDKVAPAKGGRPI